MFLWLPDGRGVGELAKKVKELRSTNWLFQNSHEDVKYSIGNIVAKEYTCITHGHRQWCGDCLREWGRLGGGGAKAENLGQL